MNEEIRRFIESYKFFMPFGNGNFPVIAQLTDGCIRGFPGALNRLISEKLELPEILRVDEVYSYHPKETELERVFKRHGTYKPGPCYRLYAHLLDDIVKTKATSSLAMLEIGLGTSNTEIVSNMGASHASGSSMYAWSDFLPNARIFGADVDRGAIFQDPARRIATFEVDQTKVETLERLKEEIGSVSFFIDDGLHSIESSLNSLSIGIEMLSVPGCLVIEDISPHGLFFWRVIWSLFEGHSNYDTKLYHSTAGGGIFTLTSKKLSDLTEE